MHKKTWKKDVNMHSMKVFTRTSNSSNITQFWHTIFDLQFLISDILANFKTLHSLINSQKQISDKWVTSKNQDGKTDNSALLYAILKFSPNPIFFSLSLPQAMRAKDLPTTLVYRNNSNNMQQDVRKHMKQLFNLC